MEKFLDEFLLYQRVSLIFHSSSCGLANRGRILPLWEHLYGGARWAVLACATQIQVFVLLISSGKRPGIQSRRALDVASFVWEALQCGVCDLRIQKCCLGRDPGAHAQHSVSDNGSRRMICGKAFLMLATAPSLRDIPWDLYYISIIYLYNSPWWICHPGIFWKPSLNLFRCANS